MSPAKATTTSPQCRNPRSGRGASSYTTLSTQHHTGLQLSQQHIFQVEKPRPRDIMVTI